MKVPLLFFAGGRLEKRDPSSLSGATEGEAEKQKNRKEAGCRGFLPGFLASCFLFFQLLSIRPAFGFDPNLVAENKNRPTSFVGVPWGARPEEAGRILSARAGVIVPEELPVDQTKIELTGGNFSGQPAEKWTLEFAGKRLFAATVTLKAEGGATAQFRDLKQMLTAKYGPVAREGKPPIGIGADKKDRRAQQRVNPAQPLFGNTASWKFVPTLADKEPKAVELTLATAAGILATEEAQLVVTIRYSNDAFAPQSTTGKATPARRPSGPDDL